MVFNRIARALRCAVSCVVLFSVASGNAAASCTSASSSTSSATVTCTSPSDSLVIFQAFGGWAHSGTSTFGTDQFDWDSSGSGEQNVLIGGTINVNFTSSGGQVTIGANNDTTTTADALAGTVNISGGGNGIITIDSTISSTAHTYTIDDASSVISVGSLVVHNETSPVSVTVIAGTAADTINVKTVVASDAFLIAGNSGGDVVNVSSAGSVQGITGSLDITDQYGFATITIDDSADATGRIATLFDDAPSHTAMLTGMAPGTITWADTDVAAITLKMGTGNDSLSVQELANPHAQTALVVQGTNGSDMVTIGNAGSVQSIAAPITVSNSGFFTQLNIDDSADPTARTATVSTAASTSTITGVAPATIAWNTDDILPVNLTMGMGNDIVNVLSIQNPLNIEGTEGLDTVTIGNGGNLQGILSPILVTNKLQFTTINIDDHADTTARTGTVFSSGGSSSTTTVSGVASGSISWHDLDVHTANLTMGTQADTLNIQSLDNVAAPVPMLTLNVEGTSGADTINIGNVGNAQSVRGTIHVSNFAVFSTIQIDDSSDTTGREPYIYPTSISGVMPAALSWNQQDVEAVSVSMGSGGNLVHVMGTNGRDIPTPVFSTTLAMGNGDNLCIIHGSALGQNSSNTFFGGSADDTFVISAVPTNVDSVSIFGSSQNTADEIIYTSGTVTGANPGNGTLTPNDVNAHAINYNSIEKFSIDDTIFFDGFN